VRLRRLLAAIFLLGSLGLGAELLLLSHFERSAQLIPLVLIGLGLLVVLWDAVRPTMWTQRLVRAVAAAQLVAGAVGIGLHFQSNVEFEREMDAGIQGLRLVRDALSGAVPALAPGALAQLGLIALAYTMRENN
jgi:hypothetical protein